MMGIDGSGEFLGRDDLRRISIDLFTHRDNFFSQPPLHRLVTLLQGSKTGAHNFAGGSVGSRFNFAIDIAGLDSRQTEGSLTEMSMKKSYHNLAGDDLGKVGDGREAAEDVGDES
jgi:hypothetical protein